jgi:hypothetical protein
MTTLLAYIWTPVLMALLALGLGLLVERVARWQLPSALLAPIGVAAAIALTTTIYELHGTAAMAAAALVVGAGAGLLLARHELRDRLRPGWAGAAALVAWLLYLGPYLITGSWTWGGYNFVNDTAVNMIYVDLLTHHGFTRPPDLLSTTTRMQASGVDMHYPMGAHALMASLLPLARIDVAALYQPFIAGVAAAAAPALMQITRRGGAPDPVAAAIAVLAVGSNLLYRYSQHGAIKEILMMMLIVAAVALVAEALETGVHAGFGAMLALCFGCMFLVFSAAGAPYALLTGVLAAVVLVRPQRASLRRFAAAGVTCVAIALLATAAVLRDVVAFGQAAATIFDQREGVTTAQFGQLLRPLPVYQSFGVWLGADYRVPLGPGEPERIQTILLVLVAAAAVFGLVMQLWRRRIGAPLLFAVCGLTAALAAPRVAPYADAKLLVLLSVPIVLLGGLGLWELARLRMPGVAVVAVLVAMAYSSGILWSDAIAAHKVRLAPIERLKALEDAAAHAGGRYWLVNEWEEFAKYLARSIRSNSGFESDSPDVVALRNPGPIHGQYFDLDEQTLEFVQRFDGIIMRRSPVASRPPSDFRRVYRNEFYELWRRDRSSDVLDHLPLGSGYYRGGIPACKSVRSMARMAAKERGVLLAATAPTVPLMSIVQLRDRPVGWVPDPARPGIVSLQTPGRVHGTVQVKEAGRYRVWLQLTSGREMEVRIDGRRIGSPYQVNTPEQWLRAGDVHLTAGRHEVRLYRRGGELRTGNGYSGELGPLALEPLDDQQRIVSVPVSEAESLCGRRWDWIEVATGPPR